MLAIAVGIAVLPFPFLPPPRSLARSPSASRVLPRPPRRATGEQSQEFVKRVLVFAIPAGITAAGRDLQRATPARGGHQPGRGSRTTAALVLMGVGLIILAWLARLLTGWRRVLVLSMLGAFVAVLVLPPSAISSTSTCRPRSWSSRHRPHEPRRSSAPRRGARARHYGFPVLDIDEDEEEDWDGRDDKDRVEPATSCPESARASSIRTCADRST